MSTETIAPAVAADPQQHRIDMYSELGARSMMNGLPAPVSVETSHGRFRVLILRFAADDTAAVDAWAKYLVLGEPDVRKVNTAQPYLIYEAVDFVDKAEGCWRGWHNVQVWCALYGGGGSGA